MDGVDGDGADVARSEDAGLLDGGVGLVGGEVLAPELDAAFDGVEVLVGLLVDVREDAGAARAAGVGVEDAEGGARGVAGDGEGVAAGECDAIAFLEGVGSGGLGSGRDPEVGAVGE